MATTKKAGMKAHAKGPSGDAVAEFLDLAGHELRSPLAVLKGHTQILKRRFTKQTERADDLTELQKMLYQIERLEHELDVYLEAARLLRGRIQLLPERCDLVALAQRLVDLYAQGASGQALRIATSVAALPGQWDARRVRLILGALLANAAKYGRDQEVVVRLSRERDLARVEVEDQGVGVPAAERHQIFRPYATGSNIENAGLGLGLYVARELARRQGGRVGLRRRPGGGSIFWIELPLKVSAQAIGSPACDEEEPPLAASGHERDS